MTWTGRHDADQTRRARAATSLVAVPVRRLRRRAWSALAYAAVPLYNWFCRATGYGGTHAGRRRRRPAQIADRTITVRFDANVAAGLPWRFEPEQPQHRRASSARSSRSTTRSPTNRARDRRARPPTTSTPADRRHLFQQDRLLLLHRADAEARREARDAGGVLRRSGARRRIPSRTISTPSLCPTPSIRCVRAATAQWRGTGSAVGARRRESADRLAT